MIDINRHIEMFLPKTALILAAVYSPFKFGPKEIYEAGRLFYALTRPVQ
jgi:hypothetical protein